jgi:hypothetical protein
MTKIFLLFFTLFFTLGVFGQFTMDDLKKYQESKKKKNGSFLDKIQDIQEAFQKNEKKQHEFTGGIKYGIAKTLNEIEENTNPESLKVLLVADKLDEQYTVFAENQEYAIYRFNNLPPNGDFVQFAIKKEGQKEVQKKYKKGSALENGNYEIDGTQSFLELTLEDKPIVVLKMVYVKLF